MSCHLLICHLTGAEIITSVSHDRVSLPHADDNAWMQRPRVLAAHDWSPAGICHGKKIASPRTADRLHQSGRICTGGCIDATARSAKLLVRSLFAGCACLCLVRRHGSEGERAHDTGKALSFPSKRERGPPGERAHGFCWVTLGLIAAGSQSVMSHGHAGE